MNSLSLTSAEWHRRIADNDPAAWVELTKLLKRWIYTYAYKKLGWMQEEAKLEFVETCVQNACLRIVTELKQFRGEGEFLGWCRVVALRIALDRSRRERRERQIILHNSDAVDVVTTAELDVVEKELVLAQIFQQVNEAVLSELSQQERVVFQDAGQLSVAELACKLNISPNNLYQIRYRVRQKICSYLEEQGYTRQKLQEWGLI
ncbi:MAG: sigma-70 family RNA polymerase sigma factor [Chloroflexota bacterium]